MQAAEGEVQLTFSVSATAGSIISEFAVGSNLPNQYYEVLYAAWIERCAKKALSKTGLKYYTVDGAFAFQKKAFIWLRYKLSSHWDWNTGMHVFYPGDDAFLSILGSPDGRRVAQLLTDYSASFATVEGGRVTKMKTIQSIRMEVRGTFTPSIFDSPLDLVFTFEDIDPPQTPALVQPPSPHDTPPKPNTPAAEPPSSPG